MIDKKKEFWRIFRFGITGGLSTLLHYVAYLVALHWATPTISYTIGYGIGLCLNYILTTFFTFQDHPTRKNAAGFVMSHVINYLLEIGLLNLLLWIGIEKRVSGILTMIIVIPINFLILRHVFVSKSKNS